MWKFFLLLLLTSGFIWVLNHPLSVGGNTLPPLGSFFSASEGFWQNAETGTDAHLVMNCDLLEDEVEVRVTDRNVPHIFARNEHDLYFAQGYVTAMYRLWQLDISTRAAAGRLSEVLGARLLAYDRIQRNRGMVHAAENLLKTWEQDEQAMAILQAYADGINAYVHTLRKRDYPLEFKIMNYIPEDWTVLHTTLFVKSMATTLCLREYDLEYSNLLTHLGDEQFANLFPNENPDDEPIIPNGTAWNFEPLEVDTTLKVYRSDAYPMNSSIGMIQEEDEDIEVGSNNWALSGSRTASGNPILCNDPHLSLSLPSIWFEIHLNAPTLNAYGASLPAMTGVISGFNEYCAWGETNSGQDVLDWFTVEWADAEKTKYIAGGETLSVDLKVENFELAGGKTEFDTIKYTIWGPVMKYGSHAGMAMKWLAHEQPATLDATVFHDINKAESVEQFLDALDRYHTPAQNFVYADVDGNIAIRLGGKLPLRPANSGRFITDGSKTRNTWEKGIPPGHNPVIINPDRGYVSSANQTPTDDLYPYYYSGGQYFEDYRNRTLNEQLGAMERATVEDNQNLQHSAFSLKAEETLPLMLGALDAATLSDDEQTVYDLLTAWDYQYRSDAMAPCYYEVWFSTFEREVWDEIEALRESGPIIYPEERRLTELMTSPVDSVLFDNSSTREVETFSSLAKQTFSLAVDSLGRLSVDQRVWGRYRPTTINHVGRIPGMGMVLRNAPGHGDALNATGSTTGPSWRMVVDLTEPVSAYVVYPGGQSGNPGSASYDDMVSDWVDGTYHKVSCAKTPGEVDAIQVIELKAER